MSQSLRLKLFGHPALFDRQSRERLPVPEKAFLLAAKLILSGAKAISRQEAAHFLFEDSSAPNGALRVMLSRVRSQEVSLGFSLFVVDAEHVGLSDQIEADLHLFLGEPAIGSSTSFDVAAFEELLAGVAESGADLSCWLRDHRFEMRSRLIRALSIFLDQAPEQAAEMEQLAHRLIEIDPYAEAGYRMLMRIRHAEGRPADADVVYRKLCARLSTDLQATPSTETAELCREITGLAASFVSPTRQDQPRSRHSPSVHVLPPPENGGDRYPLARPLVEEVIFSLCRKSTLLVLAPQTVERWSGAASMKLDYIVESAFASDGLVWKLIDLASGRIIWTDRVPLQVTLSPQGLQRTRIANSDACQRSDREEWSSAAGKCIAIRRRTISLSRASRN